MPTTDEDRVHQALGYDECLRLLGTAGIGRLAYTRSALPVVRPVSFTLREDDVVIPVRLGSPLLDSVRGAVVAFEADAYDPAERTGWTVSVVGPSRILPAADLPRGTTLDVCLVTVLLGVVQGWRTAVPAPATDS
ncbi:pyridoxamine 5'-phosphate oxidase family protein [Blastococcus sp. SYSU D00669]